MITGKKEQLKKASIWLICLIAGPVNLLLAISAIITKEVLSIFPLPIRRAYDFVELSTSPGYYWFYLFIELIFGVLVTGWMIKACFWEKCEDS
jgi:hypothetical protein